MLLFRYNFFMSAVSYHVLLCASYMTLFKCDFLSSKFTAEELELLLYSILSPPTTRRTHCVSDFGAYVAHIMYILLSYVN